MRDWLRSLLRIPVKEYTQFEAALSLMPVLPPGEVVALLKDRVARLDRETEGVRRAVDAASRQGVERVFLIEADYLLAMPLPGPAGRTVAVLPPRGLSLRMG